MTFNLPIVATENPTAGSFAQAFSCFPVSILKSKFLSSKMIGLSAVSEIVGPRLREVPVMGPNKPNNAGETIT
jgi:hypothetical protein